MLRQGCLYRRGRAGPQGEKKDTVVTWFSRATVGPSDDMRVWMLSYRCLISG